MNFKGSLPLLILHVLQDSPKHGYQIAKEIKQQSRDVLAFREGTLYPALHTLEKQGAIEAHTEQVNGHIRRYYRLTESGRATLAQEIESWNSYAEAVNLVLAKRGGTS
ncbi:MAG: PadR family transcriptional regulator [Anaerolineae bacterium]|nr:PadR family transcriptional regulator [Anaerolineae bacterium]